MAKKIKDLDIHSKVKFGRFQINHENPEAIVWKVVAKDHLCVPSYPSNSVTLYHKHDTRNQFLKLIRL